MDTTDYIGAFRNKGLICFEEITDYSLITDNKLLKRIKRKSPEHSSDDSNETKKNAKKQKKSTKTKSVSFNEKVEILNEKKSLIKKSTNLQDETKELTKTKKAKKKKKDTKKKKSESDKLRLKKSNKTNSTSRVSLHVNSETSEFDEDDFNKKMVAWFDLMLPKTLLRGLYDKGFYEPMPIQKLVLPDAIKTKSNIIGTAQTGSGKTLAFGLPILAHLFDSYQLENNENQTDHPQALILTPTRELAIQIKEHLQICCKYQKTKIVVVVGGISQIKQERLLKKKPEIIVSTPGRLMQMIDEGNEYLNNITKIKFLVIDEADRMIEKGHFGEMEKILTLINNDEKLKSKRQNFLFSATLITKFNETSNKRPKTEVQLEREHRAQLNALVEKIQMTKEPKFFDLTTKQITAENLTESKIYCSLNEKDMYMYYFALKYTGRTLVFANSIDCVRRLTNLFRLLKKTPLHLHANMNQKQRLKNLEKFNSDENSLLIASDVASRGLDIPNVMHVIHYQVPRSAEIYVHRSGRTARSNQSGLSVMLISPDEINLYRKIVQTCKNGHDLRDYPIDIDYLDECKVRVGLARKVDELEHQLNKTKNTNNWYEKNAKLLDIELDDEILKETQIDTNKNLKEKRKLQQLKTELEKQLKKMIFPKHMSKTYLRSENLNRIMSINEKNKQALTELKVLENENKKNKKNFITKIHK